jgi:hypothetical protein
MKLSVLSKSRGLRNLISRIFSVARRFGVSPKKFERCLQRYFEVTHSAGCLPTLAITAAVLKRHPGYIRELSHRGVELMVHGYVHIDYQEVAREKKRQHFEKAINIFNQCQIPFAGFRAPFLRTNEHTTPILSNLGFLYNSSRALWWPINNIDSYSTYVKDNLNLLREFYQPLDAEKYLSLPRFKNGLIEIPVSIPDDEALVERMGIANPEEIGDIWVDIMQRIYDRGELFNFSLHPERIEHCETGLLKMLRKAGESSPPVWMATLKEIAEWWQERSNFSFDIQPQGNGKYRVRSACSERATILLKKGKINVPTNQWFDGYQYIKERDFILESTAWPVIGVRPDSPGEAVRFLQAEGYVVDTSTAAEDCGLYLGDLKQFSQADEKALSRQIEQADSCLLRYWRWPDGDRCALAVTGDIDSITITDFILRILENRFKS